METPKSDLISTAAAADPDRAVMCTLGATERTDRGLAWADLGALSLTSERIDGGTASTYPISIAGDVEALAQSENSCCGSWLTASTERLGDVIRLEVTTENPAGLEVILAMANPNQR